MSGEPVVHHRNFHQRIAWSVLAVLLFLRLPFLIAVIYIAPIENQLGGAIYEVSTYLGTAFLIWWERDRLADFHIDISTLFLIVFLSPLRTLILQYWKVESPMAFPLPFALMLWLIAGGLCVALWHSGFKLAPLQRHAVGWLVMGLLTGLCISIGENWKSVGSLLLNSRPSSAPLMPALQSMSLNLIYHLGFAPINEEPLFRGFLWGYLRQARWREGVIWLFQTALFTLAHIYFAHQYPLMFWVYIPIAALVFGALTWRARSIAPAMLAHGLVNGSVYLLITTLSRLFS